MSYFYNKISTLEDRVFGSFFQKFFYHLPQHVNYLFFKLGLKNEIVDKKTFLGHQIKLALPYGKDIFLYGFTDNYADIKLTKYLIKQLKKKSTFIDVGAQFGFFSLFASAITDGKIKIYAFEPSKFNFDLLKHNLKKRSSVFLENKAVGDENKIISFFEYENKSTTYQNEQDAFRKTLNIEMIVLDNYISAKKIEPTFMRINVEKFAPQIFEGLRNTLTQGKCDFSYKFQKIDEEEKNLEKIIQLLKRYNYGIYKIDDAGDLLKLKTKQSISDQVDLPVENLIIRHSAK